MNSFGNTLRPTLLAAWRSPTRMISKPRFAHPCVNCRTTRRKSNHSTKSHPSNTPHDRALTYGLINNAEIDRQKTNDGEKRAREINTIRALAAAAVFTLILDGVGACQL